MFRYLAAALLIASFSAIAFAEDTTSALINQALDKQTKLALNNLLPQAMEIIEKQTGVPMKADPAVWDLLPWGRDTNINAKIENQTLREALEAITRKLGLQFEVKNDSVMLEPIPALRRLARRSTVQELGCLDTLVGLTLDKNGAMSLKQLLDAVDGKLAAAKASYVVERPTNENVRLESEVNIPRNVSLLEALEIMAKQTNATWYPWGKSAIVLSKQDQTKRQLARTITVRYNGVDLAQVLTELSQKSGVPFDIEPGALQQTTPEARNIRLVLDDYSIQDALEAIGGITGLDYMIRDNGVYLWSQSSSGTNRDPVLIMMTVRGTDMQLLIHASQVPADIREYLKAKAQKEFKGIHDMMKEEGFQPPSTSAANTPTTQPSPTTKRAVKPNEDL